MHEHVTYIPGKETGYFVYLRKPQVDKGPTMRSAPGTAVAETVGDFRTTRIEVVDEKTGKSIYSEGLRRNYVQELTKKKIALPSDVISRAIATPIPNEPLLSVRNVLAVFVENINDKENRKYEDQIVKLYKKRKTDVERHAFLRRLERILRSRTSHNNPNIDGIDFDALLK